MTMRMPMVWMNLSFKAKIIACLLVTSLISTLVVGGVAYSRLMHKFDAMVLNESIRGFSGDVSAYFHTYGSWDEGKKIEPFRVFSERRRAVLGLHTGGPSLKTPPEQQVPPPDAPPPNAEMPPIPGSMKPPQPGNMNRPPFRFYLFDTNFKSLVNLPPYQVGDYVSTADRPALLPIESDGRIVAHFSPQGKVNYSDLDLGYLAAMREALLMGAIAGCSLTLILGFLLASSMSGALRKLTTAVQAMGKGELKQQVEIDSKDEVGVLAQAFNRMSNELHKQYEALSASHAQIAKQAERMRELSVRDALTQLHNRRYFDEQSTTLFNHATRYQRPFSVAIADIDHFKSINDNYSHAIGDEVLRRVGEILASKTRSSDLVARYGGEEFVIAFTETDLAQAQATCEALRKRIESYPWEEVHPELKVTMSIGLNSDAKVKDVHAMIKVADTFLYRAKHGGRNQVCSAGHA